MERANLKASAGAIAGSCSFSIGATIGLLLTVTSLILPLRHSDKKIVWLDQELLGKLPASWYDLTSLNRWEAMRKGEFWLHRADSDRGFAVRLLQHRELFDSFFPGYWASVADRGFWAKYIRRRTSSAMPLRSPVVQKLSPESNNMGASLQGSMDLFFKFGADVVVFGPSKAVSSLVPQMLARAAKKKPADDPKVIFVGDVSFTAHEAGLAAELLMTSGKRAKVAILGYPKTHPNPGFLDPSWNGFADMVQHDFDNYLRGEPRPGFFESLRGWTAWSRWLDVASIRKPLGSEEPYIPMSDSVSLYRGGILFPAEYLSDASFVESTARMVPQFYAFSPPKNYDLKLASRVLDQAIARLKRFADVVILFACPETPLGEIAPPPGYDAGLKAMFLSKSDSRVKVIYLDWKDYGLDYLDFVQRQGARGLLFFDHVNYSGARKISAKVGAVLEQVVGTRE